MLRHPLARSIAAVLAVKFLLLAAGYWLLFGPERRPEVTTDTIYSLILPAAPGEGAPHALQIEGRR